MKDHYIKHSPIQGLEGTGGGLASRLSGGSSVTPGLDSDDVFSSYLYKGNGSSQSITNGIDLSGEGGLVWSKLRNTAPSNHILLDTERGGRYWLNSDNTNGNGDPGATYMTYNSNGFTVGNQYNLNGNNEEIVSWSFRQAPGFFDVITYSGDGVAGRQMPHSLGSVPGCIIIKCTTNNDNWYVYHRSVGATKALLLNDPMGSYTTDKFYDTTPTSTHFFLPSDASTNGVGRSFVAYVFAHDEQIFTDNGSESIIHCGSFEGSYGTEVNCGWEPQWIMTKRIDGSDTWRIIDYTRGFGTDGGGLVGFYNYNNAYLVPNTSNAEDHQRNLYVTPTGFKTSYSTSYNTDTHIYVAIRRPTKKPTTASEVFKFDISGTSLVNDVAFTSGWPVDWAWTKELSNTDPNYFLAKTWGDTRYLSSTNDNSINGGITNGDFDYQTGWYDVISANTSHMFRRAPGFFDITNHMGNGNSTQQVFHNLSVRPELIIVKNLEGSGTASRIWNVITGANNYNTWGELSSNGAFQSNNLTSYFASTPTESYWEAGSNNNENTFSYVAFLFGSVNGVCKIGSYTGTTSQINIDCGFPGRASFVMIKRLDGTGDWYYYDGARGMGSGASYYLLLNSNAAEVGGTAYVVESQVASGQPVNGFYIASGSTPLNTNGASYMYMAIAE